MSALEWVVCFYVLLAGAAARMSECSWRRVDNLVRMSSRICYELGSLQA